MASDTSGSEPAPDPPAPAPAPEAAPPRPRRRWLRVIKRIVEAGALAGTLGALLLWCSVPNTGRLASENPASTAFIDLRLAQAADAGRAIKLEWQWRPIARISRYLRAAVIYAEDYNFYRHDGVDWGAIERALETSWESGSLARGGSTITQQLAKNLYLSPDRSLLRKLRELLIAYRLEDTLTKQRILELYLNVVEWGDGVFGAEAAARRWYGKSAQHLAPSEAVRLAIALPNPFARAPSVSSPDLTRRAVRIIHLLRLQGLIDATQERVALDQVGAPTEAVLPTKPTPGKPEPPPAVEPTEPVLPEPPPAEPQPPPEEPPPAEPPPPEPEPPPA